MSASMSISRQELRELSNFSNSVAALPADSSHMVSLVIAPKRIVLLSRIHVPRPISYNLLLCAD